MRISDWSSDVCSSDLGEAHGDLLFGPVNVLDRLRRDQDAAARQPASGVDDEVAHLPGAVVEEQVMDVAEAAVLGGDVVVAKLLDAANHGGSSEGKGFASGQRRLRVRCSAPSEAGLEPVPVRVVAVLDPALNKNQRSDRKSTRLNSRP